MPWSRANHPQASQHILWASLAPKHTSLTPGPKDATFSSLPDEPVRSPLVLYQSDFTHPYRLHSMKFLSHSQPEPNTVLDLSTWGLVLAFVLTLAKVIYKLVSPINHMLLKIKNSFFSLNTKYMDAELVAQIVKGYITGVCVGGGDGVCEGGNGRPDGK